MSGDNGEKKPLMEITEKDKDAFLHVALNLIEHLTGKAAFIGIKQEALNTFPDFEKPVFAWDNSKQQWMMTLPKPPKPKKTIMTPSRDLIMPN